MTDQRQSPYLRPLLDHLAASAPASAADWQDWRITPIGGGANNRLYRATSDQADLAIKFTIRDATIALAGSTMHCKR